jgi:hypothetical protein
MYMSFAPLGAAAALGTDRAGCADGRPPVPAGVAHDGSPAVGAGETGETGGSGGSVSVPKPFVGAVAGRPQAWQKASPSLIDDRQ